MSTATEPAPDEVVRKKSSSTTAGGSDRQDDPLGLIDAVLIWALIQTSTLAGGLRSGSSSSRCSQSTSVLHQGAAHEVPAPRPHVPAGLPAVHVLLHRVHVASPTTAPGHLGNKEQAIPPSWPARRAAGRRLTVPGRPDREGRHGVDAGHLPRGTEAARRSSAPPRPDARPARPSCRPAARRSPASQGYTVAEPRHPDDNPDFTSPVGRAARPAQPRHRDVPEVLQHLRGQGGTSPATSTTRPPTR